MKQIAKGLNLKTFMAFLMVAIIQTIAFAQEEGSGGSSSSGSSTTTTTKSLSVSSETSDWYANPVVWAIGAAVFILLLVALLRGRGSDGATATRTDKVTVTKSTSAE